MKNIDDLENLGTFADVAINQLIIDNETYSNILTMKYSNKLMLLLDVVHQILLIDTTYYIHTTSVSDMYF